MTHIKLKLFIAIWLIASTYFAAFEIDDRLAVYYSNKKEVNGMTVGKVVKAMPNVESITDGEEQ